MSVAQCKAARRRNIARYGRASSSRTIAESMARERAKAARAAAIKRK